MAEEELKINFKAGLIALGIAAFLFILNILLNPPFIPDKDKPPVSCDSQTGLCTYPEKANQFFICGPIFIIMILLGFIFFEHRLFQKKAYIMTLREAYRKIPIEDLITYRMPEEDSFEPVLVVPKDGGKTLLVKYVDKDGFSYIKLNLMSDFKTSETDYSRKSPLISWTCLPISPYTASLLMKSDTDVIKKLSDVDKMAERLTGKPLTAEIWEKRYKAEKERMKEEIRSEEL